MINNNTHIGNATEKSASSIFREHGYWAYNCPKSASGSQPVDLIAIRNNENGYVVWLVDSKHTRVNEVSFPFSRIEPNQKSTLMYAHNFAGINIENLGFVIKFERDMNFYWFGYQKYLEMAKNGEKSVNMNELNLFEKELERYENNNR